ncbi:MAG: YeeE/YedE family protein [Halomonas sp.]|nr:YeeE/YedE family protein [Halomonas sp.]TVP51629.1 MAG: YeeE/YedE family protein [Halomonas sp.]
MDWMAGFQGLAGGIMIGLSAIWLMATLGRIAGISGIIGNLITHRPKGDSAWRLAFLLGLISGPLVIMALGGGLGNVLNSTGEVIGEPAGGVGIMLVAGLLVGVGTGLSSGCTSGHGVCGLARLAPRSIAATSVFLLVALVTVYISRHLLGLGGVQ